MGVCEGCALNFHKLASPTCIKCKKLQNIASDVERLAIEVRSGHFSMFIACELLIRLQNEARGGSNNTEQTQ